MLSIFINESSLFAHFLSLFSPTFFPSKHDRQSLPISQTHHQRHQEWYCHHPRRSLRRRIHRNPIIPGHQSPTLRRCPPRIPPATKTTPLPPFLLLLLLPLGNHNPNHPHPPCSHRRRHPLRPLPPPPPFFLRFLAQNSNPKPHFITNPSHKHQPQRHHQKP